MDVIKEARRHLNNISTGYWKAYIEPHENHDTMIEGIVGSIEKGREDRMAMILLLRNGDFTRVVATTGNGEDGIANAKFIADAPMLVERLLYMIDELRTKQKASKLEENTLQNNFYNAEVHLELAEKRIVVLEGQVQAQRKITKGWKKKHDIFIKELKELDDDKQ